MIWLAAIILTCIIGITLYTVYDKPSTPKEDKQAASHYHVVYAKGEYGWGDHLQGMFHLWTYCQRHGIEFRLEKDSLWKKWFDSSVYIEPSETLKASKRQIVDQHTPDIELLNDLKPGQLTAISTNSAFCRWENTKTYFKDWKTFWSTVLIPSNELIELVSPIVAECRSAVHVQFFEKDHCFITNPEKVKQSLTRLSFPSASADRGLPSASRRLPKPIYVSSDHSDFLKDMAGYKTWNDYYPEKVEPIIESMLFYYLPTVAICQWSTFSRIPALSIEDHTVHMLTHDYTYTKMEEPHHYVEK